jgi:predicted DNA-binding protein (UPF0251 family)/predicted Fe-Mo cluster-binding NifX family protein
MPRPFKCRRVAFRPWVTYFKPAGIPLSELEEVVISVEEAEALRLKELEGLEQEKGAEKMSVSRPTFQRTLASARRKIADGLLNGKAIRIEGGNFEFTIENKFNKPISKEEKVKIAVVTEDEKTISQHFGMAPLYMVFTVEDGKITGKEKRAKMGHGHGAGPHGGHEGHGGQHGFDAASQNIHSGMAGAIKDCQAIITGGMGMGAYYSLKNFNIEPIVTDVRDIEEAVKQLIDGKLANLTDRLH